MATKKESCDTVVQPSEKRIYKIFDPFDRGTSSRSYPNLSTYLQVPAHPELKKHSENIVLPDNIVRQQNLLTIGLTALSML